MGLPRKFYDRALNWLHLQIQQYVVHHAVTGEIYCCIAAHTQTYTHTRTHARTLEDLLVTQSPFQMIQCFFKSYIMSLLFSVFLSDTHTNTHTVNIYYIHILKQTFFHFFCVCVCVWTSSHQVLNASHTHTLNLCQLINLQLLSQAGLFIT